MPDASPRKLLATRMVPDPAPRHGRVVGRPAPGGGTKGAGAPGAATVAGRGADRPAAAGRASADPVTDRRADRGTLRRELAQIESIYRSAPVALGALDLDLRWLRVSDRMAELSGVPAAEHRGRRVDELPPSLGADFAPACAQVLATGAPVVDHEVAGRGPGETRDRTLRVSCFPIRDPAGNLTGVNLFARDVTGLLAVERLRDTFIGVLSHELRTPVTSIYTAGVLLRRLASDERVAGLAGDIAEEAEHLVRIMENLLVLARVERGASVVDGSEPALVQHVLRHEVEAERARHPDARIELNVAADLAPVACESERIALVVRNLLSNAAKYGRRGGTISVAASASPAGGVMVQVFDDGPGLQDDDPTRLFDLYYRAPSGTVAVPGAGIGLFVCRAVVEAAGGRIGARPGTGGGAEFWFEVPAFADDEGTGDAGEGGQDGPRTARSTTGSTARSGIEAAASNARPALSPRGRHGDAWSIIGPGGPQA